MKILVIDENPAMTEMLRILFSPSIFEVITANSEQDGVELTRSGHPDIVLINLMMPELGGWRVCKTLRKVTKAPIIILSALDNPALVADALDAGADDYLIKPVPNRVLTARLEKLVRRQRIESLTSLSVST